MISWMMGETFTDPTWALAAVNRPIIELFASYYPEGLSGGRSYSFTGTAALFRLKEVSVLMHERKAGQSSITPLKSLYYMVKVSLAVCMTRIRNVS